MAWTGALATKMGMKGGSRGAKRYGTRKSKR